MTDSARKFREIFVKWFGDTPFTPDRATIEAAMLEWGNEVRAEEQKKYQALEVQLKAAEKRASDGDWAAQNYHDLLRSTEWENMGK